MNPVVWMGVMALALMMALAALFVLLRHRAGEGTVQEGIDALQGRIDALSSAQTHTAERIERELRNEIAHTAQGSRSEFSNGFTQVQQALVSQLTSMTTVQNSQLDSFAQQLMKLTQTNAQQLDTLRATLEQRLKEIEANNAAKLEEMRRTVDEKLHATLEQRLGESFRLVSERLEQVHRGLGEMQTLAAGVGDLKKVLTNVKTRGTWGEVQLEALLEQMLTPDQYAKNVAPVPGRNERVEFAIRLPGPGRAASGAKDALDAMPLWLPIDAKFPREDYERLMDAQERGDVAAVDEAGRALEARVRSEARAIAEKYVSPPHTTDFALLFLPIEGLYAEVLRRPGLCDQLQREYRVAVTGPTTLAAVLNSLQMGFRTLAIERRSSEVWQVLGAVKTEFGKFGEALAKTKKQLETVTRSIEDTEKRTRAMNRKLRDVEELPGNAATDLLGGETGGAEQE